MVDILSVLHHGLGIKPDYAAHTYNIFERIAIEDYLYTPLTASITASAIAANVLYAVPYPIARDRTTSHIAIQVSTGAVAGVARLGLYADNGSCYPGALIADSGEFSVADVELSTNVFVQTVAPGLYWAALISNGTPTLYRINAGLYITERDGAAPLMYVGLEKASSTYGALSGFDPFPAAATGGYKGTGVMLRFSA